MPVFIISLMLIFFNHSNELIIHHETKSSLPQQKLFKSAYGYMLSKDLNNLNKKLYAFGNIVLKNENKKMGPGLAF